jgi:hypothetical protein
MATAGDKAAWGLLGLAVGAGTMYVLAKEDIYRPNPVHTVVLEDSDSDEYAVIATVSGPGAAAFARDEQSIGGSRWETDGPDFAYAVLSNHADLVDELQREGYYLDVDMYTPPDGVTLNFE